MKKLLIILAALSFAVSAWADTALQVDFLLSGYRHPTTDEALSGGKVLTFLDGTSTLSVLFTDKDQGGTATNPVILDSSGKAEVFGDNIYKFEIYDSGDVLIETLNGLQYKASIAETKNLGVDFDCDLPTALAAIGSVTPTTLDVECDCIIADSTSVTVTENISTNVKNGGSFDGVSGGGIETLTFEAPPIAGDYKIYGENITVLGNFGTSVNPMHDGALGDGSTDDTTDLQKAINRASFSETTAIKIPPGHYIYSQLFFYFDSGDNPGYNPDVKRHARIQFLGSGYLDKTNLQNKNFDFGTILETTETTGNGLIVASDAEGHSTSPTGKNFLIKNMTLSGDTTGYIIEVAGCPGVTFEDVSILQESNTGSGVYAVSVWFGRMKNTLILSTGSVSAGSGILWGSDDNAGLFKISDNSLISGFFDNIRVSSSNAFDSFVIKDSAIQDHANYGIYISATGGFRTFSVNNVHFESSEVHQSHIRFQNASIKILSIKNSYFLCGTGTVEHTAAEAIDIEEVGQVAIENNYIFRLYNTFLNIDNVFSGKTVGYARNNQFIHDNSGSVTPTVFLFTGEIPNLEDNIYTGQNAGLTAASPYQLQEYGVVDLPPITIDNNTAAPFFGAMGFGTVHVETGQSGTYQTRLNGDNVVYDITNTENSVVEVNNDPSNVVPGRAFLIANNSSSVGFINVKNSSDSSDVVQILAGEWAWVIYAESDGFFRGYKN